VIIPVIITSEARSDLFDIFRYIADQGFPDRALQYIDRIVAGVQTISGRECGWSALKSELKSHSLSRRMRWLSCEFSMVEEI
jgi:plasmid stabilization system protein ParE